MKFGLSEEQYSLLNHLVIKPLQSRGADVYIFGSRARGQHHPFSDIDLLYQEAPDKKISMADIAKMKEDAENSNLPIKVDLVSATSLAQSYRQSVDESKILIPKN